MPGIDIGLIIALASALGSTLAAYRAMIRSQYSREREVAHMLESLERGSHVLQELIKQLDAVEDRLSRLEILILKNSHHAS